MRPARSAAQSKPANQAWRMTEATPCGRWLGLGASSRFSRSCSSRENCYAGGESANV